MLPFVAPSELALLLASAEPARMARTSGFRQTFFDTAISFETLVFDYTQLFPVYQPKAPALISTDDFDESAIDHVT
jgi:hypothetical protein